MFTTLVLTISPESMAVLVFASVFVIIGAIAAWATYEKPQKKK